MTPFSITFSLGAFYTLATCPTFGANRRERFRTFRFLSDPLQQISVWKITPIFWQRKALPGIHLCDTGEFLLPDTPNISVIISAMTHGYKKISWA
jgi:hypothetical protein